MNTTEQADRFTKETDRELMVNLRIDVALIKDKLGDLADLRKRVGILESRMWKAVGAFGALAFLSPVVVTIIVKGLTT